MKRIVKILLAIVILLIIFAGIATFTLQKEQQDIEILDNYTTIIGKNSNGTVYKKRFVSWSW